MKRRLCQRWEGINEHSFMKKNDQNVNHGSTKRETTEPPAVCRLISMEKPTKFRPMPVNTIES
jgi:hypothetical protein